MSLMVITATCAGRITKQGLRTFQAGGETYCSFSLGVTPRVKVQGKWQNGPKLFIRCTVWDKYLAAHAINSLQAGDNVIVSGSITTEEYNGQTNLNMGVEALGLGEQVFFLDALKRIVCHGFRVSWRYCKIIC